MIGLLVLEISLPIANEDGFDIDGEGRASDQRLTWEACREAQVCAHAFRRCCVERPLGVLRASITRPLRHVDTVKLKLFLHDNSTNDSLVMNRKPREWTAMPTHRSLRSESTDNGDAVVQEVVGARRLQFSERYGERSIV